MIIKTYGTKSVWLKRLNAMNSFLTGWFTPNKYITLPVNEPLNGLDKDGEEC